MFPARIGCQESLYVIMTDKVSKWLAASIH